jgi:hypothetical protein
MPGDVLENKSRGTTPMSRDDSFPLVEGELQLRHVPFDGRALHEFPESMASLLLDDDSPQG